MSSSRAGSLAARRSPSLPPRPARAGRAARSSRSTSTAGASGLALALRKVGVSGRVLFVTAHPDDEHERRPRAALARPRRFARPSSA